MPTLFDTVRQVAEKNADRLALITAEDGCRTYAELIDAAAATAYSLRHELGLDFGDRVALWGLNRPEWVEVFLACSAAGVTCYPLNPEWTAAEAAAILEQARIKVLVHDAHLTARANALRTRVTTVEQYVTIGDVGALTLAQLKSLAPKDCLSRLPEPPPNVGTPFFFTSGTAGTRSKAVIRSGNVPRMPPMNELFGLTPDDRTLVVTPFFHGNGNSGVIFTLTFGGSVVFMRRFSARQFWPLVDRYRPTFFFTLMPIINILLAGESNAAERHNSIEKILALGVAPHAEVVEARFNARAFDWYGATEIGGAVCTPLNEPGKPGATGKPLPGRTLFILDDELKPCPAGVVGQVAFLAEQVGFGGYADDPEATKAVTAGPYLLTGDLGYLDDEGWFFFVDRSKDIVRRGGENLSSLEVEAVLQEHPDVAEIAIVPRPDPVLGERVTAFVIPKPGRPLPDPKSFRSFASKQLAAYKIPDLILPIEEMPRTQTGKIRKVELKKLLADRLEANKPPTAAE